METKAKKQKTTGGSSPSAATGAATTAKGSAAAGSTVLKQSPDDKYNRGYLTKLGNAVQRVLRHPDMADLRSASPLGIADGGSQEPFDSGAYKAAMSCAGEYRCSGAASWINEMYSPLLGVPFNFELVMKMANHNFSDPGKLAAEDTAFTIAVPSKDFDPQACKGALMLADPLESLHAMWFAADRDLSRETQAADIGLAWSAVFRKATLVFKHLTSDIEIWYHQEQVRQKTITRAGAVTLTALQRIRQVVCLKDKLEQVKGSALTVEEFHKALDRVDYSALSEPVTVNYVKAALEVHEKALSIPAVLDLVLSCEGRRVSLFVIISVCFLVSVSLAFAVVFVNGY